jgi:hypothetical protein
MKIEIFIFVIVGFLVYDAFHNNKYTKILYSYKKYYKMAIYIFGAFVIYNILKQRNKTTSELLYYANNMIKMMPIDKSSNSLLSSVFDMTKSHSIEKNSFMENFNGIGNSETSGITFENKPFQPPNRPINTTTKRSVSETKKKFVASNQNWKCGTCQKTLNHTFEIDHKLRLEYGGSNDVSNLIALCRDCHGQKTAMENM